MNASLHPQLLHYYEAIERASASMLDAARAGNWDEVVKLEGACVLLISQLKNHAVEIEDSATESAAMGLDGHLELQAHAAEASKLKSRLMQRILVNDAEIRQLAEPWLVDLDHTLAARPRVLH
ncbi:MAG: flagellar protein FliT [Rubrivivax sp.]|jgi:flagellar protein FliT